MAPALVDADVPDRLELTNLIQAERQFLPLFIWPSPIREDHGLRGDWTE